MGGRRRNCLHKQSEDNYESISESHYSAPRHTPMHPTQLVLHVMILKFLFFSLMPSSTYIIRGQVFCPYLIEGTYAPNRLAETCM